MSNPAGRETSAHAGTIRASAILTASYVATTAVDAKDATHVEYAVDFTLGTSTGLKWCAAHSHDNSTWEYVTEDDALAGTTKLLERTIAASQTGWSIKLKATRRYQRLEVKGLTAVVGTLCAVRGATIFGGA
jgi:hypothetical protein